MAIKSAYNNVVDLIKDCFDMPINNYLNKTIEINQSTLTFDIYRVADETALTDSVFTGCTANDANTQLIVGKNLSVASGVTLTPPYRCKGIFIGDVGTFTNNGTISMTARGASAQGVDIYLFGDYKISAVGGSGGASVSSGNGLTGGSPSTNVLSCAGGGSGSAGSTSSSSGRGGNGTSFSGGSGGGAASGSSGSEKDNGTAGSDTGGQGGNAGNSAYAVGSTGGAGNPNGTNNASDINNSGVYGTGIGTGGLIVIIASSLVQAGSLTSNGTTANNTHTSNSSQYYCNIGGSSGGGCIVLLSQQNQITGTYSVTGGLAAHAPQIWDQGGYSMVGGAGGTGVYKAIIEDGLILINLPFTAALTDEEHLPNLEVANSRLLGLMDQDELMYEVAGTRHRAMKTNPTFEDFDYPTGKVPSGHGVPMGTIICYFGDSAPDGYLACDGTEYLIATYPALADHLLNMTTGSQYEGTDSLHFKVPDLRGEFLRGTGTNSHTNQGNGSTVGTHQDATEHIFLQINGSDMYVRYDSSNLPVMSQKTDSQIQNSLDSYKTTSNGGTYSISENNYYTSRPTNTSVFYCIKY